jgi:hypothetical protein
MPAAARRASLSAFLDMYCSSARAPRATDREEDDGAGAHRGGALTGIAMMIQ